MLENKQRILRATLVLVPLGLAASCSFDTADRWEVAEEVPPPICRAGELRCGKGLERCEGRLAANWVTVDDCEARGMVCAPELLACRPCDPGTARCNGQTIERCDAQGRHFTPESSCNAADGIACRNGACSDLCA